MHTHTHVSICICCDILHNILHTHREGNTTTITIYNCRRSLLDEIFFFLSFLVGVVVGGTDSVSAFLLLLLLTERFSTVRHKVSIRTEKMSATFGSKNTSTTLCAKSAA